MGINIKEKEELEKIIKIARKRDGFNFLFPDKNGNMKFPIWIKIKKFKKIGFLMEISFSSFDIDDQKINSIETVFNHWLENIETPGFKQKLHVGKSSIHCAFYDGDETDVLGFIFDTVGLSLC